MSLSAMAAALEEENARLQAEVQVLRLRLAVTELQTTDVELMLRHKLTRGEASVLATLIAADGRYVDRYRLEAAIPARDHSVDRNVKIVDVLLTGLRKKLGRNVVETMYGLGWRIGPEWRRAA